MIWCQDNEFNFRCVEFKVKKTCYERNRERKKERGKKKKRIAQQFYKSQMLFGESIDF